ncbi:alpha/beta hydrolase [Acetobacterium sp.]|uniref:alpha/beta hydrolase n=1 Tax=Acetobacterium sp. TaxID=1872094 RepID=UPI002716CA39|nr:alpha/beta hydrolase [Acetobacterium sp.]MDO9490867.1 alpha/beta hydrolase [Acetobacterium sp.]
MKIKKMQVVLIVLAFLVIGGAAVFGYFFYSNLHPIDDRYLKQTLAAGFTEQTATLDNGSVINYGEGPDNGPALLLIHGQGVSWEDYAAVLPELSKNYHVFAVDCFGHGQSSHDPALYSCAANGQALIAFMERVIGEKCFVSGHSSGGILAAWLGANAPELVSGVLLEDPPLFSVTPEEMQEGSGCFAWQDTFMTIHGFLNQTAETDFVVYYYKHGYMVSLFGGLKEKVVTAVETFRPEHPDQGPRIYWIPYSWLRLMNTIDHYDLAFGESFYDGSWMNGVDQETMLKTISAPTIYLKAETNYGKDGVLYAANTDEDANKVQALLSDCETLTIKSGHDIHYEHPVFFISALNNLQTKIKIEEIV